MHRFLYLLCDLYAIIRARFALVTRVTCAQRIVVVVFRTAPRGLTERYTLW